MALPQFFFEGDLQIGSNDRLNEDTARHVLQVLRMKPGDKIQLTNGKGYVATATITAAQKDKCTVAIEEVFFYEQKTKLHLCVAFTKNTSRNEWLLEKATELGVSSITPILSGRSEKEKFRFDRWKNILTAALMQSQQYYLPELNEASQLAAVVGQHKEVPQKLIAHCITEILRRSVSELLKPGLETIVLIGPEGDFTADEVNLCTEAGYQSVSLGNQRLRTETAAMSVCAWFNLINNE